MSWKGHTFTAGDAPVSVRHGSPDALRAWCDENTARYVVVYNCRQVVRYEGEIAIACGEDVVAEEVVGHRLLHVSDNARPLIRALLALSPDEVREVISVTEELTNG